MQSGRHIPWTLYIHSVSLFINIRKSAWSWSLEKNGLSKWHWGVWNYIEPASQGYVIGVWESQSERPELSLLSFVVKMKYLVNFQSGAWMVSPIFSNSFFGYVLNILETIEGHWPLWVYITLPTVQLGYFQTLMIFSKYLRCAYKTGLHSLALIWIKFFGGCNRERAEWGYNIEKKQWSCKHLHPQLRCCNTDLLQSMWPLLLIEVMISSLEWLGKVDWD